MQPNWDEIIRALPESHFLQTSEWAEVKREVGWTSRQFTWKDEKGNLVGAANLLVRSLRPLGIGPRLSIGYVPRGPMLEWSDAGLRQKALDDLQVYAREQGLIFLKIDPEILIGRGIPGSEKAFEISESESILDELKERGWKYSAEQIQFKNTAVLDLRGTEEDWLARMKQKSRYNLRLSQRSGVTIRVANDNELEMLYKMYAQTAARDGFIIREMEYYLAVWRRFMRAGMAEPLIAEIDGQPVAGLVLFHFGKKAWYFYGMSTNLQREKMPNYLLQWEAMRLAKAKGCEIYDLWGAPDVFDDKSSMYGVFRFKDGLGATVMRTAGAWDYPVNYFWYFVYHQVLPRLLAVTRFFRRGRLRQEVG